MHGKIAANAAIRVAIVDDHRLVLDGLSARLHDPANGISIVAAETTWAGLIAHPEFPVDVVVLDLHLEDGIPSEPSSARSARSAPQPSS